MRSRPTESATPRWLPPLVVAACIVVGALAVRAPAPEALDSPATSFSATRAAAHLPHLASQPHPMGSSALEDVRSYLLEQLALLGLEVERHVIVVPDYFGNSGSTVEAVNVLARIDGTVSTGAVGLLAHYDSDPGTPGANDDAAGVAAVLETARALLAGPPLANDVVLILTDGEEPAPRFGSSAFVAEHPWAAELGVIVNLEALGGSGPSLLVESSEPHQWLIEQLQQAVPDVAAFSFLTEISTQMGGVGSDFDEFRTAGIAGFHFAYLRGSPIYHTAEDDIDSVTPSSLQQQGANTLALAQHFGALDLRNQPNGDAGVFFKLLNRNLSYPDWLIRPLGLIVVAMAVVWLTQAPARLTATARGFGAAFFAVVGSALVGALIWRGLTALRSQPTVWEGYVYAVALIFVARALLGAARREHPHTQFATGIVLIWVVLALTTSFFAPGASYLFVWPALAAVVALWGRDRFTAFGRMASFAAVTLVSAVVMVPVFEVLIQLAQPRPGNTDSQLLDVMAVVVALGVLTVELLRQLRDPSAVRVEPAANEQDRTLEPAIG